MGETQTKGQWKGSKESDNKSSKKYLTTETDVEHNDVRLK